MSAVLNEVKISVATEPVLTYGEHIRGPRRCLCPLI